MNDSRLIANYFIREAANKGETLTSMELLKLVYIAHGWMLGLYSVPLIQDRIEAWKFGPVIPDLYQAIKHYGDKPVLVVDGDHPGADGNLSEVEEDLIDQIYEAYGRYSGIALSSLTHKPNTPWARVFVPGRNNIVIPNDIIDEHYKALSTRSAE